LSTFHRVGCGSESALVGGRGSWQMGCYTKKKWFRAVNQLHIQSSLKPKHGLNDPQILTHVYTCHIHIQEDIAPPHHRRRDATAAAVMMAMFDVDQPAQPRPQPTDFRRRLPPSHNPSSAHTPRGVAGGCAGAMHNIRMANPSFRKRWAGCWDLNDLCS
jgi:hypothetical protein